MNTRGEIVVGKEAIAEAVAKIPAQLKDDIRYAFDHVSEFARKQRDSHVEFETELSSGVFAGQRLIPVTTAGAYVPSGRYAHVASAIMSIATAKAAGVENVIACSAPHGAQGIHPGILYTMDLCGADVILALGGVQGVAALAFGLFTGRAADILVGPGNRFVAEAKRILYGRVGIDVFAGPTESMVIADDSADPELVASDLTGQAEHGLDSPVWMVTDSQALAQKVITLTPKFIAALPDLQRQAAEASWPDYGEVVLCDDREEMAAVCDRYAPEHVQVQARDLDWWLARLMNYGSLFLGEETTVAYGEQMLGHEPHSPYQSGGPLQRWPFGR